ncbi:MAG TPA: hypothetical protein VGC41_00545, partial [Kofleriaceae bacterium]
MRWTMVVLMVACNAGTPAPTPSTQMPMLVLGHLDGWGGQQWTVIDRSGAVERSGGWTDHRRKAGFFLSGRIAGIDKLFREHRVKSGDYSREAYDAPTFLIEYKA